MSDLGLSLTGSDLVAILRDMHRRKEPSDKLTQVYFTLLPRLNGNMDAESQEAAEKILSGVQVRERNLSEEIKQWVVSLKVGSLA